MKNGCKEFVSPTMDKLKIDKSSENRLHDIRYAQVFLEIANRRGHALEESRQLTTELYEYIVYLYKHIEQLEKDKRYLLKQRIEAIDKLNKIKKLLKEVGGNMNNGFSFNEHKDDIDQLEKDLKELTAAVVSHSDEDGIYIEMDYRGTAINLIKAGYKKQTK